jgi:hypothetical protein
LRLDEVTLRAGARFVRNAWLGGRESASLRVAHRDRPSIGCRTGLEIEIDAAPGLL